MLISALRRALHFRLLALLIAVALCSVWLASPAAGVTRVNRAESSNVVYSVSPRLKVTDLRIMNYYPGTASWSAMWTDYSHSRTDEDFAAIAALGANTVRIIVQPHAVGWPNVTAAGAAALKDIVSTAGARGLRVSLTLFDLWYAWDDIGASKAWASQLLSPYRLDNRIALVELQNEMVASYPPTGVWANAMLPYLRTLLPGVSRTISANNPTILADIVQGIPRSSLDVVDIHIYSDAAEAAEFIATAQTLADGRPVIVGETGSSSRGGGHSEETQQRFYESMNDVTAGAGIRGYAPWTYTDFDEARMPAFLAGPVEASFGLRRLDGSWKPAADVVRAMYWR